MKGLRARLVMARPNRAEERIEHCESCGGYLKTYDGQGHETLLLSDWSSLHIDLIAHVVD